MRYNFESLLFTFDCSKRLIGSEYRELINQNPSKSEMLTLKSSHSLIKSEIISFLKVIYLVFELFLLEAFGYSPHCGQMYDLRVRD